MDESKPQVNPSNPPPGNWRELLYKPFLILLGTGLFLRILLMLLYFPAVMIFVDSPRYARINSWPLFGDFWMPAGYPMFLQLLHAISNQLWLTIAFQHLLGASSGVFVFLALRRLGVAQWIACIPAAVPLLCGDQLFQEHAVMSDFFFTLLVVAGICLAIRGLVPELHLGWLAAASVLLGAAGLTRNIGFALVPILGVCSAVWFRSSLRRSSLAFVMATLPAFLVFGCYWSAYKLAHGRYLGLSDMRGWNLYARAAPFADCRKFAVPAGTEILCEQRPPSERPGPFGYVWDLKSTSRQNFVLGPDTGKKLEVFAWRAILHQPRDYVQAVLIDLAKYIDPAIAARQRYGGTPRDVLSFGYRNESEKLVVNAMAKGYRGVKVRVRSQPLLVFYQNTFRIDGLIICTLLFFTIYGVLKARNAICLGIWLFGLSALALYAAPVLVMSYDFRYGIPPQELLAVSGVLGMVTMRQHMQRQQIGKSGQQLAKSS
jgi:hypothetical protein